MRSTSTSWRRTVWIACFAVLMNALAPAISHAMAARANVPATWELCGADGSIAIHAGLLAEQLADKAAGHEAGMMADCGYCVPHGGSFALMPPAAAGFGLLDGHVLRPFLFYRAPQPLLALAAAPPRGPPAGA